MIHDDFDKSVYRLGRLCKNGHDFNGLSQSIRYISSGHCVDCLHKGKPYIKREKETVPDHLLEKFDSLAFRLGSLCHQGHDFEGTGKSLRYINNGGCEDCRRQYRREYYQDNRDEILEKQREYNQQNKEIKTEYRKRYYQENREEHLQKCAEYRRLNKEAIARRGSDWYRRNRERHAARSRQWKEANKERLRELKRAYYQANKERIRDWGVAYREANKDKIKERRKEWRKRPESKRLKIKSTQKRRALKRQNHHASYDAEALELRFSQFDHSCAYCGSKELLSVDHFIPLSAGGADCLGNIIPACRSCNSRKHNFDPKWWFERHPSYSKARWKAILKVLGKTEATYNQTPLF